MSSPLIAPSASCHSPIPGARQIAPVRTAVLVAVFKETGSGADHARPERAIVVRHANSAMPVSSARYVGRQELGLEDRGRNGDCSPPPAQTRTGPIKAGSYLEYLTAKRCCDQG